LLLLTVPAGKDAIYKPWHRVYGTGRIHQLLEGFEIVRSQGYVKEPWGPWRKTILQDALEYPATPIRYALGQMVLRVSHE